MNVALTGPSNAYGPENVPPMVGAVFQPNCKVDGDTEIQIQLNDTKSPHHWYGKMMP